MFVTMTRSPAAVSSVIGAGEFKAKCLEIMDVVARTGTAITITKRGIPVARLVPAHPQGRRLSFGCMREAFEEVGDIVTPLDGSSEPRAERASLLQSAEVQKVKSRASRRRAR
jgi:prevent-host-death family protein